MKIRFRPVDGKFVDVLAEDDRGYSEHVRQAGQDHIPVPAMRQDVVAAANHQRSPDQKTVISPMATYFSGQV